MGRLTKGKAEFLVALEERPVLVRRPLISSGFLSNAETDEQFSLNRATAMSSQESTIFVPE